MKLSYNVQLVGLKSGVKKILRRERPAPAAPVADEA